MRFELLIFRISLKVNMNDQQIKLLNWEFKTLKYRNQD
jgi:hypothetical protein